VAGRYSNRSDLLQQLRRLAAILVDGGQDDGAGVKVTAERVIRSRWLRDRFPLGDLQVMINLYRSGATAKQVAEKFGISLRSVKRLLHQHGVRRHSYHP
jgi:Helix-turn-helix domain of resolvase